MKYSPVRNADGRPLLTAKEAAVGCWGFAMCIALFAFSEWSHPKPAPYTGRLAWMYRAAAEQWGPQGPAMALLAGAVLMLVIGAIAWAGAKRGVAGAAQARQGR